MRDSALVYPSRTATTFYKLFLLDQRPCLQRATGFSNQHQQLAPAQRVDLTPRLSNLRHDEIGAAPRRAAYRAKVFVLYREFLAPLLAIA